MKLYLILIIIVLIIIGYSIKKKKIKETLKKEEYKVYESEQITEDIINSIRELDKKFYKDEYLWENDYQLELFNKNKNSLIVVTYKGKTIGYLNYLVITKIKYEEMINSNFTIDKYDIDDITKFLKNAKNFITLNSVVVDKNFQDGYVVKILTKRFKETLRKMHFNNYKIGGINAVAISLDGSKFLENLGFEKYKKLKDENHLYILEGRKLKEYLKK